MTDDQATGIVLRTRLLTESSLIVQWITREHGRLATVAKGARRPKSPFRGKLDLFYRAEFMFRRSRRSDLHTLVELNVQQFHPELRSSLDLLQLAVRFAKRIEQTTEPEAPIPELYDLLNSALESITRQTNPDPVSFGFELQLLDHLGLRPDLNRAELTPGSAAVAQRFLAVPLSQLHPIRLSPQQCDELRRFIDHQFQSVA